MDLILRLRTQAFDNPLTNSRRNLGQFNQGLKNVDSSGVSRLGASFTGLAAKIGAAFTAYKAGEVMFAGFKKGLNLAADMESTTVAFETLIGSTEKATETLRQLKKFGADTPLEFPDIANAAKMLIAFGESSTTVTGTLRRVGDISSGVGAGIGEIAEIYGKARVSGTLFAEDINQLLGRGIPVIAQFAKQLGVSEGEVKKLASEGKITFPMLEKAFVDLTSKGGQFFNMMAKQATTNQGLMSTLADGWNEVLTKFGEPINDALKPILNDAISMVGQIGPMAQSLGQAFVPALEGMREFIKEAGNGGNLVTMLGTKLRESFAGLADVAMVPIRVMMAGLPSFGSAILSAVLPLGSWMMSTLEAAALHFGATMANALGDVMMDVPGMEAAAHGVKGKAFGMSTAGFRASADASDAADNIMPGLQQAGKDLTKVFGDIQAKMKEELNRFSLQQEEKAVSDIVKKGRKSSRESVGLINESKEGPFQETFQTELSKREGGYDWTTNPQNLRRPAPGSAPAPATPATGGPDPATLTAPGPKTPATKAPLMPALARAAAQAFPAPAAEKPSRYDAEGRRADGRKQIVSARDGSTKAAQTRGFRNLDGRLLTPRVPSPGTAKKQDAARESIAAASGSKGEKSRWDAVVKIQEALSKIGVA